jgi:hypothetical protein
VLKSLLIDSKLDFLMEKFNFGNMKTEDNLISGVDILPQVLIFGPTFLI